MNYIGSEECNIIFQYLHMILLSLTSVVKEIIRFTFKKLVEVG